MKRNMILLPIIILIIALLFALIYTWLVHNKAPQEVWNWWHTFVATVLSITIAGAIGIMLFNYQNKTIDDSRRGQFRSLLAIEISDHLYIINLEPLLTIDGKKVHASYLQPLILEDAGKSGLFDISDSERMLKIARQIRLYNHRVDTLYSSLSSGGPDKIREQLIQSSMQNIEASQKGLSQNLEKIRNKMKLPTTISSNEIE